jgi:hypothetical protein
MRLRELAKPIELENDWQGDATVAVWNATLGRAANLRVHTPTERRRTLNLWVQP